MKVLITGASGFLGQYVLAEAQAAGLDVVALTRRTPTPDGAEGVAWVSGDLRTPGMLSQALAGCDAVIHLAGAMHGDEQTMYEDTVTASGHLMDQVAQAGVRRLVLVSSLAVYDYLAAAGRGVIDEDSPIETKPENRDRYCRLKLEQEQRVREQCDAHGVELVVARPGAIYGPGRLWTGRIGVPLPGGLCAVIGGNAALPMTYAVHCARALVLCAQVEAAAGQAFNIIDDQPPTQRRFLAALRLAGGQVPRTITLPRSLAALMVRVLSPLGPRLPDVLQRPTFASRYDPMRYPNQKIKEALSWQPALPLEEALAQSLSPETSQAVPGPTRIPEPEPSA